FDDSDAERSTFNVRRISAAGQVDCRMKGSAADAVQQQIQCDRLTLATDTGKSGQLYPRQIDAAGSVHASDGSQEIRAGRLSLGLAPTTRPNELELTSFSAEQDVQIRTTDGAAASAEQIIAENQQIKLIGQPARVSDATATLTGPIIQIQP